MINRPQVHHLTLSQNLLLLCMLLGSPMIGEPTCSRISYFLHECTCYALMCPEWRGLQRNQNPGPENEVQRHEETSRVTTMSRTMDITIVFAIVCITFTVSLILVVFWSHNVYYSQADDPVV